MGSYLYWKMVIKVVAVILVICGFAIVILWESLVDTMKVLKDQKDRDERWPP